MGPGAKIGTGAPGAGPENYCGGEEPGMSRRIVRFGTDLVIIGVGVALIAAVVLAGLGFTDLGGLLPTHAQPPPAGPDVTAERAAPSPDAPAPVAGTHGFDDDVALAAAMITSADKGGNLNHTLRWAGPTVSYHIEAGVDWTAAFHDEIAAALAWASEASGLTYVPAASPDDAHLRITGRAARGGSVWVIPAGRGMIGRAHVELGCCSPRVAYEEIGQSLGVLADLGDDRSVFSANRTRLRPGDWDTWVIRGLYNTPAGSDAATAADGLRRAATR